MRSPFLSGFVHPLNLSMLALSILAGLLAAWWLLPLGLLLWLTMVVTVSRDASLQFNYRMQSRAPLAQRFQQYFDRIQGSQLRLVNSLASAPTGTQRVLQSVRDEVDALTSQVHSLCQRLTTLENDRVVTASQRDLSRDLARIEDALQRTADPQIRREYENSRQSIQERLGRQLQVTVLLDRVEAQLLGLANELDGIVTEAIRFQVDARLQTTVSDEAAQHVARLANALRQQSIQFAAFEREVVQI